MELISFNAKNFKGIENLTIKFQTLPGGNIYSFVGLNESGKTTILEALDAYKGWTETLKPVTSKATALLDKKGFIPKSKISNFTGSIEVSITCKLSADDKKNVTNVANALGYIVEENNIINTFSRYQEYRFADSVHTGDAGLFKLNIKGFKKSSRKKIPGKIPVEVERKIRIELDKSLPAVLYFPNALFDTPDEIKLSDERTEKDAYYCLVLQDVLDSFGENLNLQRHVIDRIGDENQKDALENTIKKMELKITKAVFDAWKGIFGRDLSNKKISLEATMSGVEKVLRIRYTDGADSYKISERSLGFRWFFGFLLLTQFRAGRIADKRQVIYVFDEPASNLHSSAQKKLLEIFGNLAKNALVIYSTHSHHLINPDWLENAYVVRNTGLTYERADDDYKLATTKVEAERYRTFVASHPSQTTYFQPILEVLDYQPSNLEFVPESIFVEGKNDYYSLRLFQIQAKCPDNLKKVPLIPGNGAGGLDPLIQLYSGWGKSFQILLDSDKAGKKAKQRYLEKFSQLVINRLNLLEDFLGATFNGTMEKLFSEIDLQKISYATGQPKIDIKDKSLVNKCIQECCARKIQIDFDSTTHSNFIKVLSEINAKFP